MQTINTAKTTKVFPKVSIINWAGNNEKGWSGIWRGLKKEVLAEFDFIEILPNERRDFYTHGIGADGWNAILRNKIIFSSGSSLATTHQKAQTNNCQTKDNKRTTEEILKVINATTKINFLPTAITPASQEGGEIKIEYTAIVTPISQKEEAEGQWLEGEEEIEKTKQEIFRKISLQTARQLAVQNGAKLEQETQKPEEKGEGKTEPEGSTAGTGTSALKKVVFCKDAAKNWGLEDDCSKSTINHQKQWEGFEFSVFMGAQHALVLSKVSGQTAHCQTPQSQWHNLGQGNSAAESTLNIEGLQMVGLWCILAAAQQGSGQKGATKPSEPPSTTKKTYTIFVGTESQPPQQQMQRSKETQHNPNTFTNKHLAKRLQKRVKLYKLKNPTKGAIGHKIDDIKNLAKESKELFLYYLAVANLHATAALGAFVHLVRNVNEALKNKLPLGKDGKSGDSKNASQVVAKKTKITLPAISLPINTVGFAAQNGRRQVLSSSDINALEKAIEAASKNNKTELQTTSQLKETKEQEEQIEHKQPKAWKVYFVKHTTAKEAISIIQSTIEDQKIIGQIEEIKINTALMLKAKNKAVFVVTSQAGQQGTKHTRWSSPSFQKTQKKLWKKGGERICQKTRWP